VRRPLKFGAGDGVTSVPVPSRPRAPRVPLPRIPRRRPPETTNDTRATIRVERKQQSPRSLRLQIAMLTTTRPTVFRSDVSDSRPRRDIRFETYIVPKTTRTQSCTSTTAVVASCAPPTLPRETNVFPDPSAPVRRATAPPPSRETITRARRSIVRVYTLTISCRTVTSGRAYTRI